MRMATQGQSGTVWEKTYWCDRFRSPISVKELDYLQSLVDAYEPKQAGDIRNWIKYCRLRLEGNLCRDVGPEFGYKNSVPLFDWIKWRDAARQFMKSVRIMGYYYANSRSFSCQSR